MIDEYMKKFFERLPVSMAKLPSALFLALCLSACAATSSNPKLRIERPTVSAEQVTPDEEPLSPGANATDAQAGQYVIDLVLWGRTMQHQLCGVAHAFDITVETCSRLAERDSDVNASR